MFENSRDILNISVSAAVLVVAIFLCVALFYLIANLRRVNKVSAQIEKGVDKVEGLMELIQDKIKQSSSYLFLFGKLAERAMDYFMSKKSRKYEDSEEAPKSTKKSSKKK